MAYQVYVDDVKSAARFSVPNTTLEENCARTGARRMGWTMAHAWRKENGLMMWDPLPAWMKRVLEEQGPD